jgi:hypothetical protein
MVQSKIMMAPSFVFNYKEKEKTQRNKKFLLKDFKAI